ncbi:V8-like Glu-specific endopeptidase [Kitasatospora sp. SolWspMP-SS2h]|uniref:trypsin-like serine peptidase n=1 Tax=Kitasatospora sp. SolWspMP-SS2h TaxID=1305729 RepID=UPI000DB91587|nr:serine protease [Kitasatospora sp. SolWspMP-SS2h]RAJ41416.1 V8-like Glu-specific endopeptidase [Kitasatospora sp. SolWspMP-SS2h]
MGRHTRQDGRSPLRSAALTSVLAVGVVGAMATAGVFTVHLRHPGRPSTDTVAMTAPAPAATAASSSAPTPTPTPAVTPAAASDPAAGGPDTVQLAAPVTAPTLLAPPAAPPDTAPGTTATAPDDAESRRVGALFSGPTGPGHHFCTASVIDSPGRDLILTAAHCLSSANGVTFVPGYRDGRAPYGSWQVTEVYTADGWRHGGDPDEDFAILAVAPRDGRLIEDVLGGNPLGTDASWTAQVRLYGYPAGAELPRLCTNTTSRQDTYQRRIDCPSFPGGTSGGPFVDTATGRVIGVIGGYQQGGDTEDTSYSAAFDHTVAELLAEAS